MSSVDTDFKLLRAFPLYYPQLPPRVAYLDLESEFLLFSYVEEGSGSFLKSGFDSSRPSLRSPAISHVSLWI